MLHAVLGRRQAGMKIEPQLTWGLVLIAFGWVCIAILLHGCNLQPGGQFAPYCDAEVAASVQPIIDGEISTDTRTTVKVLTETKYCTGNMLAPHTVITAAHCIGEEGNDIQVAGTNYVVLGYERTVPDLVLMYTDEELPGPFLALPPADPECLPALLIQGYGRDENGRGGVLRERTVLEHSHSADYIYTYPGICYGDSGSGLVATAPDGSQYILGVTSVTFGDCDGLAGFVNIVPLRTWVRDRLL